MKKNKEKNNLVTYRGKIIFDPKDITNKHSRQSSWKKVAMVFIKGDICEYYSWFLRKRFNLILQRPIRGAHVSFISDRLDDISGKNKSEKLAKWNKVKNKWNGKYIDITINVDNLKTMSDGEYWWFIVDHDHRDELQGIRNELGLGKPYYGLHMTIGRAVDTKPPNKDNNSAARAKSMNLYHSQYINGLINKKIIKK